MAARVVVEKLADMVDAATRKRFCVDLVLLPGRVQAVPVSAAQQAELAVAVVPVLAA